MKKKIGGVLLATGLVLAVGVGCEETSEKVEADYNGRMEIVDKGMKFSTGNRGIGLFIVRDKETGAEILIADHWEGVTSQVIKEGDEQ